MNTQSETLQLIGRMARFVANEGHKHGLKPAQWEALRYLAQANRFSRTPGGVALYLGLTKGTVSQTLMTLERAGLVKKSSNPGDGRSVRLDLSEKGRALLARDGAAAIEEAIASLPPDEQSALKKSRASLVRAILIARGGRPFGICRECRHFAADARGPGAHYCRLLRQPLEEEEATRICQEQEAA